MSPVDNVHEIYNSLAQVSDDYCGELWNISKRIERKFRKREGEVLPIYLAVVSTSRHYGGPEEGGWWYNWSTVEEVRRAWDWKTALKYARELKEDCPQPKFGIGSAANRGEPEFQIVVCSDPSFYECMETKERPYYC